MYRKILYKCKFKKKKKKNHKSTLNSKNFTFVVSVLTGFRLKL